MLLICSFYRVSQNHLQNLFGGFRYMTTTEVSTALRPFYFTVHPDLFGQYPSQRVSIIYANLKTCNKKDIF